jgi:hypothetical protein
MFELTSLDLGEIATALADQESYEHRWLIDPRTGQIAFWSADCGIDGQNPVDLDELDLVCIDPLPSYVWYQDMADFAEGISDWGGLSRAAAPSATSRPSCTRSIRACYRPGTPSVTPAPSAAPWNGSSTTAWSTKRMPSGS